MTARLQCVILCAIHTVSASCHATEAVGDQSATLLREVKLFPITSLAVSPDGERIAVAGFAFEGGRVAVVDLKSWETVFEKTYAKAASAVEWSPDGRTIAVGTTDSDVRVWDVAAGKLLHLLAEHEKQVRTVAFSPDGRHLATGSDDSTVRIWNTETGKLSRTLEEPEFPVTCVRFSPDGKQLLAGSLQSVKAESDLWTWAMSSNMSPGKLFWRSEDFDISWIRFSAKQEHVAIGSTFNITFLHWPSAKQRGEIASRSMIASDSIFSNDASLSAIADNEVVSLYCVPECREVSRFHAHDNLVGGLAFLPQSSLLVSGGWDHKLKLWRIAESISRDQRSE